MRSYIPYISAKPYGRTLSKILEHLSTRDEVNSQLLLMTSFMSYATYYIKNEQISGGTDAPNQRQHASQTCSQQGSYKRVVFSKHSQQRPGLFLVFFFFFLFFFFFFVFLFLFVLVVVVDGFYFQKKKIRFFVKLKQLITDKYGFHLSSYWIRWLLNKHYNWQRKELLIGKNLYFSKNSNKINSSGFALQYEIYFVEILTEST